ncbi:hypothetical protein ACSNOI_28930 [Actinomadura kijaniata]
MSGQPLDPDVLSHAVAIARAGALCATAVEGGAPLVVVDRDPAPYDHPAAEVVREPAGVAPPRICDAIICDRKAGSIGGT